MNYRWLCSKHGKGMAISIGLHLFFIGLGYLTQLELGSGMPHGKTYTIALKRLKTYNNANKIEAVEKANQVQNKVQETEQETESVILEAKTPIHQPKVVKKERVRPQQKKQNQSGLSKAKTTQKVTQSKNKIDKRGLYNVGNLAKKTGATLELTGWEWDMTPNPKDTTEEYGKIVFEIKVDENGEIISIQTIEKTVTPMVEKIYSDALRELTFSKTSTKQPYSSVSTGKVTFILVAK